MGSLSGGFKWREAFCVHWKIGGCLYERKQAGVNSGEGEAVGKADRRAEGPSGCGICGI